MTSKQMEAINTKTRIVALVSSGETRAATAKRLGLGIQYVKKVCKDSGLRPGNPGRRRASL